MEDEDDDEEDELPLRERLGGVVHLIELVPRGPEPANGPLPVKSLDVGRDDHRFDDRERRGPHRDRRARDVAPEERAAKKRVPPFDEENDDRLLALDEALRQFEAEDPRKAELVKLRFFAGLTAEQASAALGISTSTAEKDWAYARSWLRVTIDRRSGHRP